MGARQLSSPINHFQVQKVTIWDTAGQDEFEQIRTWVCCEYIQTWVTHQRTFKGKQTDKLKDALEFDQFDRSDRSNKTDQIDVGDGGEGGDGDLHAIHDHYVVLEE